MSSPHRPPDPRSGLVLETHDLGRRAGTLREVRETVDAPEGLGIDVIEVPPGSPIELDLRLESVVEGVLVSGTAELTASGDCARCLVPIEEDLEIDILELYLYPDVEEPGGEDEDASRLEGDLLDLEPVLRDAVVLDLPFTPLCRPDCAGLCPDCGADLNRDPGHSHGDAVDPRWGELGAWGADDPEGGSGHPERKTSGR